MYGFAPVIVSVMNDGGLPCVSAVLACRCAQIRDQTAWSIVINIPLILILETLRSFVYISVLLKSLLDKCKGKAAFFLCS